MSGEDQQYPILQPRRRSDNGHPSPYDDQTGLLQNARRNRQRSIDLDEEAFASQLPPGRFKNALIAGVIAGALCSVESIIIAFANTSTYQQAGKYASDKLPVSLALTIAGMACLSFFIGLLICLVAGYITGRVSVQRSLGFVAGFVAGVVTYGISFLLNFIPNYPGHLAGGGSANVGTVVGGIVIILIFFLVWGVIAGLVSLFGAWLATRRHPYYVGY
jgi:MFS family permease